MNKFESALFYAKELLKASQDKITERFQKIKIYSFNSRERISIIL